MDNINRDYNLIAKDFSRTRDRPWYEIRFLFSEYLFSGDRVLDLGCGNGRNIIYFNEKLTDYYGVDSSSELIKIAKSKYPQKNFRVDDALELSFASDFFDKVYSIAVFHQIPSQELRSKFLKEVKRVLKPKGLVVLTVWKMHKLNHIILALKSYLMKFLGKSKLDYGDVLIPWGHHTKRYYHFFSERELKNVVKKAGFKLIESGVTVSDDANRQNVYIVAQKI